MSATTRLMVALTALVAIAGCRAADAEPATTTGAVRLNLPASIVAGETFELAVHVEPIDPADAPPTGPVTLTVVSAFGTRTREVPATASPAPVTIPGSDTQTAGLLTVVATGPGLRPSTAEIEVRPGPAVAPVVPLIGPRTIVADGTDHTMVSLLVVDHFGNPVADGTELMLRRRSPDGTTSELTLAVDHHVARTRLSAGTIAGSNHVSAALDGRAGPAGRFDEVAGPADRFRLSVDPTAALVADGRSLVPVTTDRLIDDHGNVLPDGTVVEFRVDGPDGLSSFSMPTIGGRATGRLIAPDLPGSLSVTAHASGTASDPLDLEFEEGVSTLPVSVRRTDREVHLEIGPVLDELGAFVADGRTAHVAVDTGSGPTTTSVPLIEGRASLTVPRGDDRGPVAATATVGGRSTTEVTP